MSGLTTDGALSQYSELFRILEDVFHFFRAYVLLGLVIIGFFGNTVSFVIFFRARKRADALVEYLGCLALSDTGVLLINGGGIWLKDGLPDITDGRVSFNIVGTRPSCKFFLFAMHVFECISAWVITSFTLERMVVVWYPLKRASITSGNRRRVLTVICLTSLLVSIHRLFLVDYFHINGQYVCFFPGGQAMAVVFQIDNLLFNYLPSVLIFLSNIMILIGIANSRATKKKLTKLHSHPQEGNMIVSLMFVSTLYVIFLFPASTMMTYFIFKMNDLANLDMEWFLLIKYVTEFLDQFSVMNYCCNFIIYGCTLPFFRKEFVKMLSVI
jgi:hypothetical protein